MSEVSKKVEPGQIEEADINMQRIGEAVVDMVGMLARMIEMDRVLKRIVVNDRQVLAVQYSNAVESKSTDFIAVMLRSVGHSTKWCDVPEFKNGDYVCVYVEEGSPCFVLTEEKFKQYEPYKQPKKEKGENQDE